MSFPISNSDDLLEIAALIADDGNPDDPNDGGDMEGTQEQPVVRAANIIITQALDNKYDDIKIIVSPAASRIILSSGSTNSELPNLPKHIYPKLLARYKRMAHLNINEHNIKQKGQINVRWHNETYIVDMQVLPTGKHEEAFMHIHKI